jgi:carboxylesterase
MQSTRWPDWYAEIDRAYVELRERCDAVFAVGLSMGGALALRLAEEHPEVAGLVLVNPAIASRDKRLALLPVLKWVVPSFPGIGSDIKREGITELAYTRAPLKAAASLVQLQAVVRRDLPRLRAPVLVYRSRVDHVVDPLSGELLVEALASSGRFTAVVLEDSYHVATLDNDAETIFAGSLDFVRAHASAAAS